MRGVAILSVFFYHAFYWSYGGLQFERPARLFIQAFRFGWLGVNLFFVLSGFLITGILLDSRSSPQYFQRFYIRRALRILPIFYLVLFLLALMPDQSHSFLWMSFFYLSNIAPLFGIPMSYPILWSLAVEEHFYFLWPLIVRKISSRGVLWVASGIAVAAPLLRALHFSPAMPEGFTYLSWLVADGLAMGAILAVYVRGPQCTRKDFALVSAAALGLAVLMIAVGVPFGILSRVRLLGASLLLTAAHLFFAGLLGMTLLVGTSRWSKVVNRPVLQFFGEISYGLYLIHLLVSFWYDSVIKAYFPDLQPSNGHFHLVLMRFAVSGGVATGLAFLSRRFFEERFLRMKDRFAGPSSVDGLSARWQLILHGFRDRLTR